MRVLVLIPRLGGDRLVEFREEDSIIEADPILMLPPRPHFDWVIKKVAEVKRRLGYSFKGIEQRVEEFFSEIERSWSLRRNKGNNKRGFSNQRAREFKNLHSGIQYEREERGRERKIRRRGKFQSSSHDKDDLLYLECYGAREGR